MPTLSVVDTFARRWPPVQRQATRSSSFETPIDQILQQPASRMATEIRFSAAKHDRAAEIHLRHNHYRHERHLSVPNLRAMMADDAGVMADPVGYELVKVVGAARDGIIRGSVVITATENEG